jgi:hypothetical protein
VSPRVLLELLVFPLDLLVPLVHLPAVLRVVSVHVRPTCPGPRGVSLTQITF